MGLICKSKRVRHSKCFDALLLILAVQLKTSGNARSQHDGKQLTASELRLGATNLFPRACCFLAQQKPFAAQHVVGLDADSRMQRVVALHACCIADTSIHAQPSQFTC